MNKIDYNKRLLHKKITIIEEKATEFNLKALEI